MITVHIVEKVVWQFSHSVCCAYVTRNKYAAIHKASRAYNSVANTFVPHLSKYIVNANYYAYIMLNALLHVSYKRRMVFVKVNSSDFHTLTS